jgi:dipeptidyl aminopeptidase/acylaminoacyl peptidase
MRNGLLRVVTLWMAISVARAAPAPIDVLFGDLEANAVLISPDGRLLATAFPYGEKDQRRVGLAVLDIATKQSRTIVRQQDATVADFAWAGNDRLVVTLYGRYGRVGLYGFNSDGKEMCEILPLSLEDYADRRALLRQARVLYVNRGDGTVLAARSPLVGARERARKYLYGGMDPSPGIYRINTRTGEFSSLVKDPGRTTRWVVDAAGRVRVAWGYEAEAFAPDHSLRDPTAFPPQRSFWIDDEGQAARMENLALAPEDEAHAIGFHPVDGTFLFASRQGRDRAAIYAYSPRSGKVEGPVVASDTVDVLPDGAVYSPHDGTVAAIEVQEGRSRMVWLDPKLKVLAAEIDAVLPEFVNTFTSWSLDRKRVLVRARSTKEPGRYYLYDETAGTLEEVFALSRELRRFALSDMAPVVIKARDEETLHGYLARPTVPPAGGRAPSLILLVHGGPWIRETAGYNPIVQFFATRGYAVLCVNFRGSKGFGRRFEELGKNQFGTGMIDDLIDATEWAVREGITTRDRIAIAGASYGGYATLRGLTRHPDRFKAGIALLPVADVIRQIEDYKRKGYQLAHAHWLRWVGDPQKERAPLMDISPIYHLSRLQAPLFVGFGEDDERIDYQQSVDLVRQLREHRKRFTHVEAKDAGHNFGEDEVEAKVFREIERFLAQHFPP